MSTRSINKYFLLGTMALTGMVGFTACSSDEVPDNGKQNPTYNNGTVKTQFALNVPQSGRNSRMTAGNTQQTGHPFLGMSGMHMLSFGATVETGAKKILNQIDLGTSDKAFESDENRRIYRDVVVPVGTQNFVFYGTATTSGTDYQAIGKLNRPTWDDVTDLANVEFSLSPIDANVNLGTSTEGAKIIVQLNTVLEAEYNGKKWSEANVNSADQFEKHAAKLYASFIKLRAGSYASVKSTLESLIEAAGKKSGTTYTNDYENLLADIATKAQAAIEALDADDEVKKFPGKYNLPDGVSQIAWDNENNKFKAVAKDAATFTEENKINYSKITYPATLDYTVNTPVKANDKVLTGLTDWPDKDKWSQNDATIWGNDDTWKNEVTINSRSIALKNAVQYAVATLATTVKMSSSMNDNGKASGLVADNTLYAMTGTTSNFWLTGILVGGQPSKVGWDYKATSTTGAAYDYAIYDNDLNEGVTEGGKKVYKLTESASKENYTLVLDNNNGTQEPVVYVTLELVNKSGSSFYGKDGVVPDGGTFYLVGKLDLTKVTPSDKLNRIFLQDYKTKAAFTISSLKNAYNCIPDLRSSSISVGLAVDLTWEEGLSFTEVIE